MTNYPRWFLPTLIGVLLLMLFSGLLLTPTTLSLRASWDLSWRLPGAGRVMVAALHAAGGFALMLLMGALWSLHMRSGWRRRKQRTSGLAVGLLLLGLALSAIGIYYLGDDDLGNWAAGLHLGLGLALTVPMGWHGWHGRQAVRMQRSRRGPHRSPAQQAQHAQAPAHGASLHRPAAALPARGD
ncbi:MAG: hypothetical protein RJA10_2164 [Pseudomonadota bacterium]|jgi:hypothetical protein